MTKVLRSVRFNIFLGVLITLAAAVGTLLPQVAEAPEKAARFSAAHPHLSRLFDLFGLFDLYHSYWFMALLGLMAVDIVLCKLWNLPPDQGLVALPPEDTMEQQAERHWAQKDAALRIKPYRASFDSGLPYIEALERARLHLAGEGYAAHEDFRASGGAAFVAARHGAQRWGSYLAHIGLVTILVGALVRAVFGFAEMAPVMEGSSLALQNKPGWELFVDKFEVKYYAGTHEPKSFSSVLRVASRGRTLGAKTIRVNDPLDIAGVRFYQASWGAGGMFRSATLQVGHKFVRLRQRAPENIPGTPFTVEADVLMPNFTIRGGAADTDSLDLRNPAVRLSFRVGSRKARPIWLLQNEPDLCFVEADSGELSRAPAPPFRLVAVDAVLFSGIQVAYDPGFKVVLGGALLWLLGMVVLFGLHRRRLWILVEPAGAESRVSVGGWSSRSPREFEAEFSALMRSLHGAMAPRSDVVLSLNPLAEA